MFDSASHPLIFPEGLIPSNNPDMPRGLFLCRDSCLQLKCLADALQQAESQFQGFKLFCGCCVIAMEGGVFASFEWCPVLFLLSVFRAATDHNVDNTTAMLREWLKRAQRVYHYVEWRPMEEPRWVMVSTGIVYYHLFKVLQTWILSFCCSGFTHNYLNSDDELITFYLYIRSYTDEWGPKHWPPSRFNHVMKLRQAALKAARERWADYILVRLRYFLDLMITMQQFSQRDIHSKWLFSLIEKDLLCEGALTDFEQPQRFCFEN